MVVVGHRGRCLVVEATVDPDHAGSARHWIAATGCLGWLCYVAADVKKRDILAAALYSHFLNFWWIILVITLYFFNADIQGI